MSHQTIRRTPTSMPRTLARGSWVVLKMGVRPRKHRRYTRCMEHFSYKVEAKPRAVGPRPFRWEIYRDGKSLPVSQSRNTFATEGAALDAGHRALDRLLDREAGDVSQRAKSIVDRVTRDD